MDFVLQIFHELKLERGGCFASNLHPAAGSRCHDPDGTPGCTYAVRYAGQAWIVGFGWVSHALNLGWSENKKPPNPMVDHHSSHWRCHFGVSLVSRLWQPEKNTFSMSPMLSCCFPTCAIASYSIYSPKFHDFHSHHIVITLSSPCQVSLDEFVGGLWNRGLEVMLECQLQRFESSDG